MDDQCASHEESERFSSDIPLPCAFLSFLEENGLDASIYTSSMSVPRYIRLKPGNESIIPLIEAELKCELKKVDWLLNFFSIPPQVQIASTEAYKKGKIYGIDAASGAAVSALAVSAGDHVLDLCAAPGAKLCMLADLLGSSGSLTGVDISRHRLAACRTMLQKYGLGDHCRLFVADGTSFSLLPMRVRVDIESGVCNLNASDVFKDWSVERRWMERKANKRKNNNNPIISEPELLFYGKHSGILGLPKNMLYGNQFDHKAEELCYDRVLVDAECTHDGSVKHIKKFKFWGWETLQTRMLSAERIDNLLQLQLQLLTNGFKLLRNGGFLVYSTCSLTISQNENVVERFLSGNKSAELVEIDAAQNWPYKSGRIPKTLRFDPSTSQTSGLFIAKFVKKATF